MSLHPRWCNCRGTGWMSAPSKTGPTGVIYDKVAVRCPGMTPQDAPEPKVDQKRKASGEVDSDD